MTDERGSSIGEHIQGWIDLCERGPTEVPMTLMVSGRVVTGFITPVPRYYKWRDEVMHRVGLGKGKFSFPAAGIGSLTEQQKEHIRKYWQELSAESAIAERDEHRVLRWFVLRDATILGDTRSGDVASPFLEVAMDSVDGYALGFVVAGETDVDDPT